LFIKRLAPTPAGWAGTIQLSSVGGSTPTALGNAVATDSSGNVIAVGTARGSFAGNTQLSLSGDAVIAKASPSGAVLWTRQLGGTGVSSRYLRVATDSAGNIFAGGFATAFGSGVAFNGTPISGTNAILTKFDSNGNVQWTQFFQVSNPVGCSVGGFIGVSVDSSGNVFAVNSCQAVQSTNSNGTQNTLYAVFLNKYAPSGSLLFSNQIGSMVSSSHSADVSDMRVSVAGDVFVTLYNLPQFGVSEVMKFDNAGNTQWASTITSPSGSLMVATALAVDLLGETYVSLTSTSSSTLTADGYFLTKLDASGGQLWRVNRNLYSNGSGSLDLDLATGTVYLGALTIGATSDSGATIDVNHTAPIPNSTPNDGVLEVFDSNGNSMQITQFGTPQGDGVEGIAFDPVSKSAFVTGFTAGNLDGTVNPHLGRGSLFIKRLVWWAAVPNLKYRGSLLAQADHKQGDMHLSPWMILRHANNVSSMIRKPNTTKIIDRDWGTMARCAAVSVKSDPQIQLIIHP
jgi:hypothetical protein